MEHYFIARKYCNDELFSFNAEILGKQYTFYSLKGVFNYRGVDEGTMALLEAIKNSGEHIEGNVLDIGCGLGVIGIVLAHEFNINLILSDINENTIDLTNLNIEKNGVTAKVIQSNAYENIKYSFDYIITNPPIKAGKAVLFDIVLGAYDHLNMGGKIMLVIRKNLGMDSLRKAMVDRFGNCKVVERNKGYYILESVKTNYVVLERQGDEELENVDEMEK